MPGERHKQQYRTQYQTGVVTDESHGGSFYHCELVGGACQRAFRDDITYGVGAPFNRCYHDKEYQTIGRPGFVAEYTQRRVKYSGGRFYPTPTNPTYEVLDSELEFQMVRGYREVSTTQEEIELKRYDAFNKLIHLSPERHMNVARSVMELKDTKQTVTGMLDFIKWGKRMLGKTVVLKGVKRRLNLLTNVAVFAEAYLTLVFGVMPTVSDVKQFLRELSEGKLRVKGHRNKVEFRKGSVVTARYVAGPTKSQIEAEMFYDSGGGSAHGKERVKLYTGTSYITVPLSGPTPVGWSRAAEVRVRREVGCYFAKLTRDLVIPDTEWLARRWEWNCPSFRTLWDLCPFSFLVDWVVDVGTFIERLEKRYVSPSYRQYLGPIWLAWGTQIRKYRPALDRFTVRVTGSSPPDDPGNGGFLNLEWDWAAHAYLADQVETFERQPVTPPTAIWPEVVMKASAYQISTGMALIASTAKKLR